MCFVLALDSIYSKKKKDLLYNVLSFKMVGFEILTAVTKKSTIFLDVTPRSFGEVY
jgi:hypothetical protein